MGTGEQHRADPSIVGPEKFLDYQGLCGQMISDLWFSRAPGPHVPSVSLSLVHPYRDQTSAIRI